MPLLLTFTLAAHAAPTATVTGACPGHVHIHVSGASPWAPVAVLWSSGTGPATIPAGALACGGATVQVDPVNTQLRTVILTAIDGRGSQSTWIRDPNVCTSGSGVVLDTVTCLSSSPVQLPVDTDLDGLSDSDEMLYYHTDPNVPDTDGDGVLDGTEVWNGTDPLDAASF
ncbi:MAG: hypothetical protein H6738_21830 [Alphaproteobacteria bacterium]|nr:hypothetical protein [Alphaproteobacteria bacterium]MCB9699438.1 hypothetical protein [Alphaproteobacteria bacterium]